VKGKNDMSLDLLILGCGYTGRFLARLALRQGLSVLLTSRQESVLLSLASEGIQSVPWHAGEPLPARAQAIVVLFPPRGLDPEQVADTIGAHEHLVYCSSTSVYGPQHGAWVDASTPVAPKSPWAIARVAAENAFVRRGASIVRAAGIYGPGRSIIDRARAGRLRVTGDLTRPVNMIHVEALAALLLAVATRGEPRRTYIGATGQPTEWIALATKACEITGTTLPEPSAMPEDPNYRMFYEESKRCRPDGIESVGVVLKYPNTLIAMDMLATNVNNT